MHYDYVFFMKTVFIAFVLLSGMYHTTRFFYQKGFIVYNYIIMGTQRRNYKHWDRKRLHRSIMAITSGPKYLKHKNISFYQYLVYKYLINNILGLKHDRIVARQIRSTPPGF